MFKLMFVAACLAVAAAAPAPQAAIVPVLKSGEAPASTSHAAHLVAPIAYSAPVAPIAYSAPVAPIAYSASAAPLHYSAPAAYSAYSPYTSLYGYVAPSVHYGYNYAY